ncbi:MAG: iron ABC transporter permease, partial [Chloroflexota bacterium]
MALTSSEAIRTGWAGGGARSLAAKVGQRRGVPLLLLLPTLAVLLVVLTPVVYLVMRSAASPVLWSSLFRWRTLETTINSLVLVAAVAITSVLIAVPFAWLTTRT